MSALHRKVAFLGGLPPKPSSNLNSSNQPKQVGRKRDYTPVSWSQYFDTYKDIVTDQNNHFRVYVKGNEGPVVFFLHGGGFSGLSWALLSSILNKKIVCQCYAVDLRGHGDSQTLDDEDLSTSTQANDIKLIIEALWKDDEEPPIVLVGHSMGGAIAIHTSSQNFIKNLVAVIVIDVVEGSAIDALSSMQSFLQGRPKYFNSIEHAIEYSVRSGQIRNVESAKVSMTGQIRKAQIEQTKTNNDVNVTSCNLEKYSHSVMQTQILEDDEENEESNEDNLIFPNKKLCAENLVNSNEISASTSGMKPLSDSFKLPQAKSVLQDIKERYTWRIDLTKTEKYWTGWFKGLSKLFLSLPQPKLLLLAGVDRLDKELMVGQMQGRFQMQILPQCGHAVHEDSPNETADAIATFLVRNKLTESLEEFNRPYPSC